MSINPIELLRQKVTSIILNNPEGLGNEKSALLSKFYPIFLSILDARPDLIQKLNDTTTTPSLSDVFGQNEQAKNGLLINLISGKMNTLEAEKTIKTTYRLNSFTCTRMGNRFSNSLGLVAKFICFRARFWQFNRSYSQ